MSRYLLLEFPVLTTQDPPQHVVELGCGCGSALLPILKVRMYSSCLQRIFSSLLPESPRLSSANQAQCLWCCTQTHLQRAGESWRACDSHGH